MSLSLLEVAGYVFPLLTVPYLAHVLGVNYYGEIAFASAIMVYFQTLVDYGFIFSAVRDIARCRDDKEKVSTIYSKVMWTRAFLVVGAFLLLVLTILFVPKFRDMWQVLMASFLIVVGHAMFPDWMFQAVEKMKYITIFNVGIKLLFTAAVFIFIRAESDYLLQPIFTSLGYIISGIGAMWLIHHWGIKISRPRRTEIFESLKSNTDLFINQLVPNLYNSASVLLLGFMHGNAANGIFDAASKFNSAGSRFFAIISRTFYPFLSRRADKHGVYQMINMSVAALISIALLIAAPFLINTFFPPEFKGAIPVLQIVAVSLIFLAMNNVYGTNFLILRGYERRMRQITLYSSIIGLCIGVPSVYYLSYTGVAITIMSSRAIMGTWSWIEYLRIKRLS